jgi:hypothetical protein
VSANVARKAARKKESESSTSAAQPTEIWCHVAVVLLVVLSGVFAYLGSRPGGSGPVLVYNFGRDIVFVLAFVTLIFAVVCSLRRPPLARPGRMRGFVALALVIGIAPYRLPYPSSREDRPSRTQFELPIRGTWRTYWGGDEKETNRLVGFFADQRFGLHLVREVDGQRLRPVASRDSEGQASAGLRPQDYWSHGETVHAPAAGRVVELCDGIADSPLGRPQPGVQPAGNRLVLCTAEDEFLFLSHLLTGSFLVAQGDEVEIGQSLARVGYSGFSPVTPEPHVALHLQTTPLEGMGEGIPWRFHGYTADGKEVGAGMPRGGVDASRGLIGQLLVVGPIRDTRDSDH